MGEGIGSGQGGAMGILWAIIWFLLVIFIGWPIAGIVAGIYVFLLPFGACIEAVKGVNDALLKVVQLPFTFAENMVNQKEGC